MEKPKARQRITIRARIIALTLAFTLVIALLVLLGSLYAASRQINSRSLQAVEYQLKTAAMTIRQRVDEIDDLSNWFSVNAYIRTYMLSNIDNSILQNDIQTKIDSKYNSAGIMPYIQRLLLASTNGKLIMMGTASSSSRVITLDDVQSLPGLDTGGGASWEAVIEDPLTQPISHISGIPISNTFKGAENTAYTYISASTGLITDVVRDLSLDEGSRLFWYMGGKVYRIDGGGLTLLDADPGQAGERREGNGTLSADTILYETKVEGERCSVVACPLGVHELYLAESIVLKSPLEQLPSLAVGFGLSVLVIILLLGGVLTVLLRRTISGPIGALQQRIELIGQGDFTPDPSIEWNHELGDVGRGINRLSENVTVLMEKRIEDAKQKQDLEFRMLQGQINPHFIYNTLNSIRWMASIQHADGIVDMVTALSRLLKSVSKGTKKLIPLRQELGLLNDYFTIQRYRYGGTVTLETKCEVDDETLDTCLIPRFSLQPLAENSVFHGIEPKNCAGCLTLTISRSEGQVLVTLSDDGVGMTAEQIEKVFSEEAEAEAEAESFRHVGLWNVHKRLQYSFGEASGLRIESVPGEGTTVSFLLPERWEGEQN